MNKRKSDPEDSDQTSYIGAPDVKEGDRRLRRTILIIVSVLLGVTAAIWFSYKISNLLFILFVSLFVAVAMEPAVHYLVKRGWKRGSATGVVFSAVVVLALVFVMSMVPLLVDQVGALVAAVPSYVEDVTGLLGQWFGIEFTPEEVEDQAMAMQEWLTGNVGNLVGGVIGLGSTIFGVLFFIVTVGLFSFYMVAELPTMQSTVLSFLKRDRQQEAMAVWDIAVQKMGGYIYSRLILAVIGGSLATAFFLILEVPFAVPLGVFVGILSQFIPVVGTYLAAFLPAVVALSVSPLTALWVVVFLVVYQQVENFVISPRITRRTMQIHPAVSIAAIMIGGSLMGAIGIVLALPMTAIIQAVISTSLDRHEVVVQTASGVASD